MGPSSRLGELEARGEPHQARGTVERRLSFRSPGENSKCRVAELNGDETIQLEDHHFKSIAVVHFLPL